MTRIKKKETFDNMRKSTGMIRVQSSKGMLRKTRVGSSSTSNLFKVKTGGKIQNLKKKEKEPVAK